MADDEIVNLDQSIGDIRTLAREGEATEAGMDERERMLVEKKFADMDTEARFGIDMSKVGFIDTMQLAEMVYMAGRCLDRPFRGEVRPSWQDTTDEEQEQVRREVERYLVERLMATPEDLYQLAIIQLTAAMVDALRPFTKVP